MLISLGPQIIIKNSYDEPLKDLTSTKNISPHGIQER